jgi:hypothetical protein
MELGKWIRLAGDRAAAIALIAFGLIVIAVGWMGVSGRAYPAEQLPFIISGGIGGMCLLGLGGLFWLSSDLRDEWTALDRIQDALRDLAGTDLVDHHGLERAAALSGDAADILVATGPSSLS